MQWAEQRYLLHRLEPGERVIPCRNIREHHESSAGGRKENNAARGVSGGWEGAPCSQVFGDWPHSAAVGVWVGGDIKASRCRLMLRVFTVPWCVGDMLGPPHRTWPSCLRDAEKMHMQGGWFSHHNLLCSFPSLRECLCASTCTNLSEVYAAVLLFVQCWAEGGWRMNSSREMWRFMEADNFCDPSIPHALVLCACLSIEKIPPANHRKCKFITKVLIIFILFFLLVSLIPIPALSCGWARSMHTFQSTGIGHIFCP